MAAKENDSPSPASKKGSLEHRSCLRRLEFACKESPFVKFMLKSMEAHGCPVNISRHISCEKCPEDSIINGGFDPSNGQIVLCENRAPSQRVVSTLLTHELIHAFDFCRAHVEWDNLKHVACTEIRAASLSGDCSFVSQNVYSHKFGFKKHHQNCVRERAMKSVMSVRNISKEDIDKAMDDVWDICFNDFEPFDKIPRNKEEVKRMSRQKYNYDL
ncbi:mitochondrial inner membrane protease ATP23 homolog [Antedon mediterranea]|uniref:mitochondrial inner membrane protease ATP23 homolog n=1 Tax=Antedon mediterranea TaxID=105859 RepID=UPI003AF492F7